MKHPHLVELLTSLADDELILGHRDAEWTGHAPILEEDIAFSNLAQDEIGHSLVWYTIMADITRQSPDRMGFERDWKDFRCCRFVTYPKGDFAYTVVRQYLFDVAEILRLRDLQAGSHEELRKAAGKILPEEGYHLKHSEGLIRRLGDATEESHRRMQAAADEAFPQALGIFERLSHEEMLIGEKIFKGNDALKSEWISVVAPTLKDATLEVPVNEAGIPSCEADEGGRKGDHTKHLQPLIADLQQVYQSEPGTSW